MATTRKTKATKPGERAADRKAVKATPATAASSPLGQGGELQQQAEGAPQILTTNQGVPVSDNQNSLKAGARGPVLLQDFILREKIMHFDHERIPERVVHARGSAAARVLRVSRRPVPISRAADFLQRPGEKDSGLHPLLHGRREQGFGRRRRETFAVSR